MPYDIPVFCIAGTEVSFTYSLPPADGIWRVEHYFSIVHTSLNLERSIIWHEAIIR